MLFEKVSMLCQDKNISIAKLERECEMGNGTVRGWKTSSPSIENLKKVADYFGITVDELISDVGGEEDACDNSSQYMHSNIFCGKKLENSGDS